MSLIIIRLTNQVSAPAGFPFSPELQPMIWILVFATGGGQYKQSYVFNHVDKAAHCSLVGGGVMDGRSARLIIRAHKRMLLFSAWILLAWPRPGHWVNVRRSALCPYHSILMYESRGTN